MEDEVIKTITIRESPYDMIELAEIVDKLEYFDEVYKTLKLEGFVRYRDYEIVYKYKSLRNKINYIWYDDSSLPIKYYNTIQDLANDLGMSVSNINTKYKTTHSDILTFKSVEGYVERVRVENTLTDEEKRIRINTNAKKRYQTKKKEVKEYTQNYYQKNKEKIKKYNREKYQKEKKEK